MPTKAGREFVTELCMNVLRKEGRPMALQDIRNEAAKRRSGLRYGTVVAAMAKNVRNGLARKLAFEHEKTNRAGKGTYYKWEAVACRKERPHEVALPRGGGMTLTFTIPGQPVGKQRPRKGRNGRFYTPAKTQNYEKAVAVCGMVAKANYHWPVGPTRDEYLLHYEIYHGRGKGRRPDADNVCKCLMDGLEGIIWENDSQVVPRCRCVVRGDEKPRVLVTVERLEK